MKNPFNKKTYIRPELVEVELDTNIILLLDSKTPPDQSDPGLWNSSESPTTTSDSTEEPLEKNNFEENPFQR
jgi:hypothetical protein